MEPVFMALGQSTAFAVSIAIYYDYDVQDITYKSLKNNLLKYKQVLKLKIIIYFLTITLCNVFEKSS